MADPRQAARKTAALARAGRALQELGGALLELALEEEAAPTPPPTPVPPRKPTRDRLRGVVPTDLDRQRARRLLPPDGDS